MDGAGRMRVLSRGIVAACPGCGGRGLFRRPSRRGWLRIREACPSCGLVFERTHGHWIGAVAVNTVLSTVAILIVLVVAFVVAWPDPEVLEVLVPTVATSLVAPLAFAPISRSLWTAMVVLVLPPDDPPSVGTRPI
ncbi:MAG: DUF983 domain-containing protein [Acidimicrobiales bacterium]|nr:DUF983 domain-containing protein [Acidimicrobiales bacterium]MDP6910302.1 DUF983 domain-containing protein [Acidimicrobiales bacterium]